MSKNCRNFENCRGDVYFTPNKKVKIKDEPITPNEDFENGDRLDLDHPENYFQSCRTMRKSMSVNDFPSLRGNVKMEYETNDNYYRQEPIFHFQRDTPNRFHSNRLKSCSSGAIDRMPLTRPQSPAVHCKTRSPPHVISQKEKEDLELEEIRKYKIKPEPTPKSVIEGTGHLPEVQKKQITVPEPCNEMQNKLAEYPDQVPNFIAQPAPKNTFLKPFVPVNLLPHVAQPVNSKLHLKAKCQEKLKHDKHTYTRTGPVRPEPFSFEKRDEELKKRKEARIKRQIEEEKKLATLFKAQPLPGAVKKPTNKVSARPCSSLASSENKENHMKFEAKPAAVLYKKPFKPVLQVSCLKFEPFQLSSEKRAVEREKFDKHLKEKEEKNKKIRQQMEEVAQDLEKKGKAKLRAKLIHYAKPAPAIVPPFVPEKSTIPPTVPETPTFIKRMNQR